MKLLLFVLNDIDELDGLLVDFKEHDIRGATIIDSTGMVHLLCAGHEEYAFGSLRALLDLSRPQNKTIFMVCEDDKVKEIQNVIENRVGDLDNANTGILFTIPVDYVKGLKK